jgi:hypothetical protein
MRLATLIAITLSTGCVVVTPKVGGPPPTTAPIYSIAPGAGTTVEPGTQAGFGITANTGSSFRVVWTGDAAASGTYREFTGSIYTAGHFVNSTPGCADHACPLEANDSVGAPEGVSGGGEQIVFDTFATDGLDGLDFVVDTEPAYFTLLIDGESYPELVFFPSTNGQISSVASIPFGLTTH